MRLEERCLAQLAEVTGIESKTRIHRKGGEYEYVRFKERALSLLSEVLGKKDLEETFTRLFLGILPALLAAASGSERWSKLPGGKARRFVREFVQEKRGHLSISALYAPLLRLLLGSFKPAEPVLDIGMGNGRISRFVFQRKFAVGSDARVGPLLEARDRKTHGQLVSFDAAAIPYPDRSFNTVVALNCIYHIQLGRERAIEEMARVLRPGGTLLLTDVSSFIHELKPLYHLYELLGFPMLQQHFKEHFLSGYGANGSMVSPNWYEQCLGGLGFKDVRVSYYFSPVLTAMGYLFYDLQALFSFAAQDVLETKAGSRFFKLYLHFLEAVVAPAVERDERLCAESGKGSYMLVVARKKGSASGSREKAPGMVCPLCKESVSRKDGVCVCHTCRRVYPVIRGIPLMTKFYADFYRKAMRKRSRFVYSKGICANQERISPIRS